MGGGRSGPRRRWASSRARAKYQPGDGYHFRGLFEGPWPAPAPAGPCTAAWGSGAAPPRPCPARPGLADELHHGPAPLQEHGRPPQPRHHLAPALDEPALEPGREVPVAHRDPQLAPKPLRVPSRPGRASHALPGPSPRAGGGDARARGGAEGVPESRARGALKLCGGRPPARGLHPQHPRVPRQGRLPRPPPAPPGPRREPRPTPRSFRKRPAGGGQGQGTSSHGGGPSRRSRGGVLAAPGWRVTPWIWAPSRDRSDGWNRAPSGRPRAARRGTALPARTHAPLYAPSL